MWTASDNLQTGDAAHFLIEIKTFANCLAVLTVFPPLHRIMHQVQSAINKLKKTCLVRWMLY